MARIVNIRSVCIVIAVLAGLIQNSVGQTRQTSDYVETVRQAIGSYLDELDIWEFDLEENAPDWEWFFGVLDDALKAGSIETLAFLQPMIDDVTEYLANIPPLASLADWLQQRRDYFDMAAAIIQQTPETEPAPVADSTAMVPQQPLLKPPPSQMSSPVIQRSGSALSRQPVPRPVSGSIAKKRGVMARDPAVWKRSLASRQAPPSAKELVPILKQAFKKEGVPGELVWIAEVESTMDPRARNPSGACGLFQLMPGTAKSLGLQTDRFNDERLDPEKSARAAARYLKTLYGQFKDWPLTVAAFNAGRGRVAKLLNENKATSFEAIADSLPIETQMYVPKVAAIISLREKADLALLPSPRL